MFGRKKRERKKEKKEAKKMAKREKRRVSRHDGSYETGVDWFRSFYDDED